MHMHKIQQMHNLSRIYFNVRKYDEWFNTVIQTLNYLLVGDEPSNYSSVWNYKVCSEVDQVLLKRMITQILNETIYLLWSKGDELSNLYRLEKCLKKNGELN